MTAQGEALSRPGCRTASGRGRVEGPSFILPEILPPEAPMLCSRRAGHVAEPSLKRREISSFMISLVPP